jgi:nitric oxide reductase NorD protein
MNAPVASAPPWIGLLLSGLAGRRLRVQATPDAHAQRPVLTDEHLLLPGPMLGDDGPQAARAAVAHAMAHLSYSVGHQPTAGLKPMTVAVVSALEDVRVERLAMAELPGLRRWWAPFHGDAPAEGDLSFGAFVARLGRVLFDPGQRDGNHWVDKGRDLFERQAAIDLRDRDAFRRIGSVLANDLGQMRVRFEPQKYRVEPAYRDDNSYLWTHAERHDLPPPEVQSLDATPQLGTLRLSAAQAAPDGESQPEEIELGRYLVPEWDHRIERYRRDWCTVVETVPLAPARATTSVPALPPPLPRAAAARLSRARRLRRQLEGDEIDVDAAIEVLVDVRLGLAPDARLFKRSGREAPHTSLLVLLDLSESVNDPVAGDGRPVLALEQEAALRLAQTVRGPSARVAVHGFNSNTREHVAYQRLVDFGAPFDAGAAGRVSAARARHSTRIGAALRHAVDMLAAEPSTRHTVLVVTDGAPSDIDVFDLRYLVEDARVAVQEANRRGVQVHCVTLDPAGERDARRIFGWRRYRVVTSPTALEAHLRQVQARAAAA